MKSDRGAVRATRMAMRKTLREARRQRHPRRCVAVRAFGQAHGIAPEPDFLAPAQRKRDEMILERQRAVQIAFEIELIMKIAVGEQDRIAARHQPAQQRGVAQHQGETRRAAAQHVRAPIPHPQGDAGPKAAQQTLEDADGDIGVFVGLDGRRELGRKGHGHRRSFIKRPERLSTSHYWDAAAPGPCVGEQTSSLRAREGPHRSFKFARAHR